MNRVATSASDRVLYLAREFPVGTGAGRKQLRPYRVIDCRAEVLRAEFLRHFFSQNQASVQRMCLTKFVPINWIFNCHANVICKTCARAKCVISLVGMVYACCGVKST
jgi:hypothetical protein